MSNKFCTNCGESVDPGQAICGACFFAIAPPVAASTPYNVSNAAGSQRVPAMILAFMFGGVGMHAYYLGNFRKGICMSALFVSAFFLLGLPFLIVGFWAMIDFFRMAFAKTAEDFEACASASAWDASPAFVNAPKLVDPVAKFGQSTEQKSEYVTPYPSVMLPVILGAAFLFLVVGVGMSMTH